MNNDALAVKFTDEKYCSRQEVSRALGTSLIDTFWFQILNYRKQFVQELFLYDASKNAYKITLTSSVNNTSINVSNKLARTFNKFNELDDNSYEKKQVINQMLKSELSYIAKSKKILINDIALENIIDGKNTNALYEPLVNYLKALNYIEENFNTPIDDDLLATFLTILNGGGELISFYRTHNIVSSSQRVLINREYNGAPVNLIESMVYSLLSFIKDSNVNVAIKLASVNYMFNYIKPFDEFNDEISILLMKMILAQNGAEYVSTYIPLENILEDNNDELTNARKESQKTNDLTYFVNVAIQYFSNAASYLLDKIVQISRDAIANDYYSEEKNSINDYDKNEEQEENDDIIEKVEIKNKAEQIKPKNIEKASEIVNNSPSVDVSNYEKLDEKALNKAAEELLESDPNLRPSQAHFFVRHCTMGKYYTIQQFKKAEKCVYETARTSMDNLARRGYYRREQIKNKFVYTPISK